MIAVTGMSGHLGQWVVHDLLSHGHDVLGISRRPTATATIRGLHWPRPPRTLACDLGAPDGLLPLREFLPELRAVVHLAAHLPAETARNADEDADATMSANTYGTARLITLLAKAPRLETIVYASTFEVYGAVTRSPVDETHPTEPTNYYGASKLLGEKYLKIFEKDQRKPVSALRLPAIYGPGDSIRRAIGNFVRAPADGTPIQIQGDGSDLRELVYVGDAARAVSMCVEQRATGVFNIASGHGISIREMAEAVQRVAERSVPIVVSERVKPRADFVLDVSRARQELGWTPATLLDDGVRAQLAWVVGQSSA
jgi:UDP-glucose 4-epimerase